MRIKLINLTQLKKKCSSQSYNLKLTIIMKIDTDIKL